MQCKPFRWSLDRPLAVFDIESTGINPRFDRIIDLAIVKVMPSGERTTHCWRLNPQMPIPPASTAIHGISDADVAACPVFADRAAEIESVFEDADLAGYNLIRFDIPILVEEFVRTNRKFLTDSRRIIDAQRIFHRKVPRDLPAALAYYCGELHLNAHGALPDAEATFRVLEAQMERYPDLPREMEALDVYCNPRDPAWADRTGKLKWANGQIVLNFGRRQGESLAQIIQTDLSFINWMMKSDFPRDTKDLIRAALQGKWPAPPHATAVAAAED
jgi:DNA polymerase-3 subunit epsilon